MYRIHVNSNRIRSNAKHGTDDPVITVRDAKNKVLYYCHEVEVTGPSKVVYSPDKPLPCGAKVWIETGAHLLAEGIELKP
jgi:hypothetical protein